MGFRPGYFFCSFVQRGTKVHCDTDKVAKLVRNTQDAVVSLSTAPHCCYNGEIKVKEHNCQK